MDHLARVFEATDPVALASARAVLESEGIRYIVEGENYAIAAVGWAFRGDAAVWIAVPADLAEHARNALGDLMGPSGTVHKLNLPRPVTATESAVEALPRPATEPGPDRRTPPKAKEVGEDR